MDGDIIKYKIEKAIDLLNLEEIGSIRKSLGCK